MQLDTHVQALQAELAALAGIGDEQVSVAADRLSQALAPSLRLRLLELLSEAALEVSSQLQSGHVEIRLAGQEPSLVYVQHEEQVAAPPAEDGLTARITLRLPDSLKSSVEGAAAKEGVSVNTWIVKALARGLTSVVASGGRVGSRLTGYGQS
jgi:predicted HicB family RNase H-like nuclease